MTAPVCSPSFCQRVHPPGWSHPHEQLLLIAELFGKALYMNIFCSVVVIFSFISICLSNVWHHSSVSETAAVVFLDGVNTERMQGWNDGKMCCYQPNHGGTGSWTGIVLAAKENVALERFSVLCFLFIYFIFIFFPHCPEPLKPGNDFCRQQESSASSWRKL